MNIVNIINKIDTINSVDFFNNVNIVNIVDTVCIVKSVDIVYKINNIDIVYNLTMFTMLTKRTQVAVNADALKKVKERFGEFLAMGKLIGSLLNDVADGRLFYNGGHWYSTETPMQREEQKEEQKEELKANPVSANDMLSVTAVPERAQGNVFRYRQIWDLRHPTDISKDLASYRKELKSSYGTDSQLDAMNAIIGLKFNGRKEGDDLKSIPGKNEPTLYNFFQWKGLNYLAEQIDSLIQDVIDIDNTEDEEEYEPDLNYAD